MNIQEVLQDEKKKKFLIIGGIALLVIVGLIVFFLTRTPGTTPPQLLSDVSSLAPSEGPARSDYQAMTTIALSADATTIAPGQSSIISWAATNATACTDGAGNPIDLTGRVSVTPQNAYTFDITCTGPKGTDVKSLTIEVTEAPIIRLSASPSAVVPGDKSSISWDTFNADRCTDSFGSTLRLSGSISVAPKKPYTFEMNCVGPKGTTNKSITIEMADPDADAVVVGFIEGNILTVTEVISGKLFVGQTISGKGIAPGTKITSYLTGRGGEGTYTVTPSQNVPSTMITAKNPDDVGATVAKSCTNGTTNYPNCTTLPDGSCLNGAINPPSCTVQPPRATAPSATLTANGSSGINVNIGDIVTYIWSSSNSASASSTYSATGCKDTSYNKTAGTPWIADTTTGSKDSDVLVAGQAGCKYSINYNVSGPEGVAKAIASVSVNTKKLPATSASMTANGATSLVANVGDTINWKWDSTGGTSWLSEYVTTGCKDTTMNKTVSWVATTANDGANNEIASAQSGCSILVTYNVSGPGGSVKASASVKVAESAATGATFTGYISGTTLTVVSIDSGKLAVGQVITGAGIQQCTTITARQSGLGAVGTYDVNTLQTIGSSENPIPMSAKTDASCGGASSGSTIFTGYISDTTLTAITALPESLFTGYIISGTGVTSCTKITAPLTGRGGKGTYTINTSQTIGSVDSPVTLIAKNTSSCSEWKAPVAGKTPTITLSAPTAIIQYNTAAVIKWTIKDASYCIWNSDAKPIGEITPDAKFTGSINDTTLTISNVRSGSPAVGQVILEDGTAPGSIPQDTRIIGILNAKTDGTGTYTISTNTSATEISIKAINASSFDIGLSGLPALVTSSGSKTTSKLKETRTFTLTCSNGAKSKAESATVEVGERPVVPEQAIRWISGEYVVELKAFDSSSYRLACLSDEQIISGRGIAAGTKIVGFIDGKNYKVTPAQNVGGTNDGVKLMLNSACIDTTTGGLIVPFASISGTTLSLEKADVYLYKKFAATYDPIELKWESTDVKSCALQRMKKNDNGSWPADTTANWNLGNISGKGTLPPTGSTDVYINTPGTYAHSLLCKSTDPEEHLDKRIDIPLIVDVITCQFTGGFGGSIDEIKKTVRLGVKIFENDIGLKIEDSADYGLPGPSSAICTYTYGNPDIKSDIPGKFGWSYDIYPENGLPEIKPLCSYTNYYLVIDDNGTGINNRWFNNTVQSRSGLIPKHGGYHKDWDYLANTKWRIKTNCGENFTVVRYFDRMIPPYYGTQWERLCGLDLDILNSLTCLVK